MARTRLLISGIAAAILASGCATYQFDSQFDQFDTGPTETRQPIEMPKKPEPVAQSNDTLTFDRAGVALIMEAWEAGEANAEIVRSQNRTIKLTDDERRALIQAGSARETQLQIMVDQQRFTWWNTWFYRFGMLALGVTALQ